MKTLFSLCLVGLIVAPLLPLASAHGVCVQLQPRFGRLDAVSISNQSIQTGDTFTITGNITSLVKKDLLGYLSIHSSPSPHARWIVVSTEPSGKMINVTRFSKVPFSMTIKALQPGTYKLSPMLYLPDIGPAFGMLNGCNTEPVVTVTGESMCNTGFVSVLKAEDGSSFCVKPTTAQKLIERGWTKEVIANPIMSNQNSNQTISVVSIKGVPPVTPGGPTIQLTLKNIGNIPITSLKVTLEVNNNYTFDFKDVTPTTPLVPNNSTSQTQILIGAGFQTDVQHPIIITGTENNTQFTYTENVYIQ